MRCRGPSRRRIRGRLGAGRFCRPTGTWPFPVRGANSKTANMKRIRRLAGTLALPSPGGGGHSPTRPKSSGNKNIPPSRRGRPAACKRRNAHCVGLRKAPPGTGGAWGETASGGAASAAHRALNEAAGVGFHVHVRLVEFLKVVDVVGQPRELPDAAGKQL